MCSVLGSKLTNGPTTFAVSSADDANDGDGDDNSSQKADVRGTGGDVRVDMNGDVPVVECDSFCDFIRFEGTVTEHVVAIDSVSNRLTPDDAGGSGSLLRTCTEKYKLLFEALVAAHILCHNESLSTSFIDSFVTSSCESCEREISSNVSQSRVKAVDTVELSGLTKNIVEAFALSCQLLVDFSALPMYSESAISSPAANSSGKKLCTNCSSCLKIHLSCCQVLGQ